MRNLKRVLSLALALVMVLGMMVITTSAAAFTDADEITKDYKEAVDVINMIGVIEGRDTGAFDPDGILNRAEAAKIVCYILMSPQKANKLVGSGVFSDMTPSTKWAEGYIDYCASLGILKGIGGGKFNPEGKLTAVQYGKMLLCALGYDAAVEGYEGDNWATNIAADMIEIGLDVEGVAMDAELTREAAAQMTFQALEKEMVWYQTKGTSITVNGMEIVTGASAAEGTKELLREKYFAKLTPVEDNNDFGVPGHGWAYGKSYVFVADDAIETYDAYTKATVVKADLKGYKLADVVELYVDGKLVEAEEDQITSISGIAYETQDYNTVAVYGEGNVIDTVVVVNVHAAVVADSHEATEKADAYIEIAGVEDYETEEFVKGDVVLYTKYWDEDVDDGKGGYVVDSIDFAKEVPGELSAFTSGGINYAKYTVDGKTYQISYGTAVSKSTVANTLKGLLGEEVSIYLGVDGKIVYAEKYDDGVEDPDTVYNYGYLIGYANQAYKKAGAADLLGNSATAEVPAKEVFQFVNAEGEVVALNGAVEVSKKGETTFVAEDIKEGLFWYVLDEEGMIVAAENAKDSAEEGKVTKGAAEITKDVFGTDATLYILIDAENEIFAAYTGYAKVPTTEGAMSWIAGEAGNALVVAIETSLEEEPTTDGYNVFFGSDIYTSKKGADGKTYCLYTDVYVDGVQIEGGLVAGSALDVDRNGGLYTVEVTDGIATLTSKNLLTGKGVVSLIQSGYIKTSTGYVYVNADTEYFLVEIDDNYSAIEAAEGMPAVSKDATITVLYTVANENPKVSAVAKVYFQVVEIEE